MGNDAAIGFAGSQGNFELNVFKPVMIYNFLHSVDAARRRLPRFVDHCVRGIEAQPRKHRPVRAEFADAGHRAQPQNRLRQGRQNRPHRPRRSTSACAKPPCKLGYLTGEEFDALVNPEDMTHP